MAKGRALKPKPRVLLTLQTGTEPPCAYQIDTLRLTRGLTAIAISYALLLSGTLLFFRELERNRTLQERVLSMETQEALAKALASSMPAPLQPQVAPAAVTPAAANPALPVIDTVKNKPAIEPQVVSAAPLSIPAIAEETDTTSREETPALVKPRLGDLGIECLLEKCEVRLSLLPTGTGTAQGSLVLVLETEVPRIGSTTAGNQIRKRFFIYPGFESRDEFATENLDNLSGKAFRFTRALSNSVTFQVGKLLRPLAINLYLYDKDKTLILHERKAIETVVEP